MELCDGHTAIFPGVRGMIVEGKDSILHVS